MADSILTNMILQLGNLVAREYQVLQGVGDELKSLEDTMRFMKRFLRNSEGKHDKHESVSELVQQINEVAFEAEDVIENFVLHVEKQQRMTKFEKAFNIIQHASMLKKVSQQISGIKKRIIEIYENKAKFEIEMGEGSNNPHLEAALLRRRKEVDENMVGFRDVQDLFLKKLTEGSPAREVISVVGMGGLGKTTVAKSLHNHQIIHDHFTCRAWVTVSEDYNTRQVILEILNKVSSTMFGLHKLETEELKEKLKERLKNKKYIVFLDDVWQTNMWSEVEACFPDESKGSRILITSRQADVARYASHREPYFLRYLEDHEGWELFEKIIFRGDRCSPYLKLVGMNIVKKCKGLPLSIVVIASMLASQEKSQRIWERTLTDVGAQLNKDEVCLDILALSYHNLPVMLKPCILYFAAFPEDYEMFVRRLIALWLAEGFVQPLGELSLEEVAESYLDDLVDRSLIQARQKRTDGGLKTCQIHDLIRDLCIREAKRENFMWGNKELCIGNKCSPRRVSIPGNPDGFIDRNSSSIRALLCFNKINIADKPALWKKMYTEYKLLRVLDLGASVKFKTVPDDIRFLINLRYLRILLKSCSIPNSISDLWNLKMLFLNEGSFDVPIGALLKLQCLEQLKSRSCRIFGNPKLLSKMQLKRLRRLSCVVIDSDFESAIKNGLCPNLRKLSVKFSKNTHYWSLENFFSGLRCLQSLTLLATPGCWIDKAHIAFNIKEDHFPSSLTKITLKYGIVTREFLQMFGKCPSLRILKLEDFTMYEDGSGFGEGITSKGLFPRLQTLHLDNVKYYKAKREFVVAFSKLLGENAAVQLRHLFVNKCSIADLDYLLTLPNLCDVQFMWPNPKMTPMLEKLKEENKSKFRLLVYRG